MGFFRRFILTNILTAHEQYLLLSGIQSEIAANQSRAQAAMSKGMTEHFYKAADERRVLNALRDALCGTHCIDPP